MIDSSLFQKHIVISEFCVYVLLKTGNFDEK